MKNQAYRMAMLFDFYGDLLTERQREFYDLYYNEDLSLAEIAENYGITRQGVRDVIVRAEAVLTELEDKTGLIKRFHSTHRQLEQLLSPPLTRPPTSCSSLLTGAATATPCWMSWPGLSRKMWPNWSRSNCYGI